MPKLAIYVSKQDMKSIERWRKRINFSKVFIQAVFDEIRRLERSTKAPREKLGEAVDYYRTKLTKSAAPLTDFGFELGNAAVMECRLSPEIIQRLVKSQESVVDEHGIKKLVEQALDADLRKIDEYARQHSIDDKSNPAWRSAIYAGYRDGVASAWEKVCEQMREQVK